MECLFCDQKSYKQQIIGENKYLIAVLAYKPITRGHTIFIPKKHIIRLENFKNIQEFFDLFIKILRKLKKVYGFNDFILQLNNGKHAEQHIPHLHIHLIPRYPNVKNPFKSQRKKIPKKEISKQVKKIKST